MESLILARGNGFSTVSLTDGDASALLLKLLVNKESGAKRLASALAFGGLE
jgi:hypothetical protein